MKQARLEQLSDGIFAIVMTLLVLEIRVPTLHLVNNGAVSELVLHLIPLFLTYTLSFLLLFTYWREHHYITSVLAENIDNTLTTINALFFLFVGLVPFSALLLGKYYFTQAAIAVYGINIIIIGLIIYWMRQYILSSPTIRNSEITPIQLQHGTVRILFPVFTAAIAIVLSFFSAHFSLFLFTLAIIFNLSGRSTTLISSVFPNIWKQ